MQILEFLSILRRRWFYVALGLVVGLVAGFVTAPGVAAETESFQGTHALLVDANSPSGQALNLEQTVLVVKNGAVPQRVAARLAEAGLPLYTKVAAAADPDLRSLDITAYSTTAEGAATAANFFAEELNAELVGAQQSVVDQAVAAATTQVTALRDGLAQLDAQIAVLAPEDPNRETLLAQRQAIADSYQEAQAELQSAQATGSPTPPLRTLEAATGRPEVVEGWRIPESKPTRAAMLGLFGLLLGMAGAIASERLDTRVRNKEDAERAFDLPVIAEIPPLPSGTKGRELLVTTRPSAPFVEAYRALRTVVLYAAGSSGAIAALGPGPTTNGNGKAHTNGAATVPLPETEAQVLLVTSPSAGEGKTTTVAHLAAVLAEFGTRVLVISADFRRPRVHELFDVAREPGLSDVLESGSGKIHLSDLQIATGYAGVSLLPSGSPVHNPAQLLTQTRALIAAARKLFDFVIVDTPPLLVANDATELAAVADMVLLMAKADRTSRDAALRSTEMLRRVNAPLLGVVVTAAHDTPTAYGYYRYRYYAEADQGGSRASARRARKAAKAAAKEPVTVGAAPNPEG